MPRALSIYLMVCVVLATTACGNNPAAPSNTPSPAPTPVPPGVPPFPLLFVNCAEVLDGYKCNSVYQTSYGEQGRDVTGLSTWSTSDTGIATVDSTGFVKVARAGNVAIRAIYRDVDGFLNMSVEVGGFRRYFRDLSGWVTDSQDGSKILNVDVRIVNGPNTLDGKHRGQRCVSVLRLGARHVQRAVHPQRLHDSGTFLYVDRRAAQLPRREADEVALGA